MLLCSIRLKDVKMEVAMETAEASDEPMRSVEKCACPQGYTGMSCEVRLRGGELVDISGFNLKSLEIICISF